MKKRLQRITIGIVSLICFTLVINAQDASLPARTPLETNNIANIKLLAEIEAVDSEGMNWIMSMAINPQGSILALGRQNGSVSLYALPSLQLIADLNSQTAEVSAIEFSQVDQNIFASASINGTILFWDTDSLEQISSLAFEDEITAVLDIAWHPSENMLAFSSGVDVFYPQNDMITIMSVEPLEEIVSLSGHDATITSVEYSPDGKQMISGDTLGTIIVWDVDGYQQITTIETDDSLNDLAYCSNNSMFASVGYEKKIHLWNTSDFASIGATPIHGDRLYTVIFDTDCKLLLAGDNKGFLQIVDVESLEDLLLLKAHEYPITALAFAPDNSYIVTGSTDGTVRFWGIEETE